MSWSDLQWGFGKFGEADRQICFADQFTAHRHHTETNTYYVVSSKGRKESLLLEQWTRTPLVNDQIVVNGLLLVSSKNSEPTGLSKFAAVDMETDRILCYGGTDNVVARSSNSTAHTYTYWGMKDIPALLMLYEGAPFARKA